ncbi:hypothetical protein D9758_005509 [Tetrapyrgos nigripes]|uniref:Uncharacterized protein n=1 Tax=Tetrapyrgos nigripes TaxID=182062 RepID=A0A8H5LPE8_9AGAR|nr:hypothetical protein D9758_005509 [Tetrapyrgos nigripes]
MSPSTNLFEGRPINEPVVFEVILVYRKPKALKFKETQNLGQSESKQVIKDCTDLLLPPPARSRTAVIREGEVRLHWIARVGCSLHRTLHDRLDGKSKNAIWRKDKAVMLAKDLQYIKFNTLDNVNQLTSIGYEPNERPSRPSSSLPRRPPLSSRIDQSPPLLARFMHSPPLRSHHHDVYSPEYTSRSSSSSSAYHDYYRRNDEGYTPSVSRTPDSYEPQTPHPMTPPLPDDWDVYPTRDTQSQPLDSPPAYSRSVLLSPIDLMSDDHDEPHTSTSQAGPSENSYPTPDTTDREEVEREIIVIEDTDDEMDEQEMQRETELVDVEAELDELESQATSSPVPVHSTHGSLYTSQAGRSANADFCEVYHENDEEEEAQHAHGPGMDDSHDKEEHESSEVHGREQAESPSRKRKREMEQDSQQYTFLSRSEGDAGMSLPVSDVSKRKRRRIWQDSHSRPHPHHPHPSSDIAEHSDPGDTESMDAEPSSIINSLRQQLEQERLETRKQWLILEGLKVKAEKELKEARAGQEALKKRLEVLEKEKRVAEEGKKAAEAERNAAEAMLCDVRTECKEPFVVPALLEAFVTVTGLAMDTQAGPDDPSGRKIWKSILERLQVRGDDSENGSEIKGRRTLSSSTAQ